MSYVLRATRTRPMNKRQEERFHDLVARFHLGGQATRLPGYDQDEDESHTESEIILDDKDRSAAESEFRCCGFVVSVQRIDTAGV
jgi:hypothetical protein